MAKLTLKSLTCVSTWSMFGDDDVEIEVDGDAVWQKTMDSDETRDISGVQVDFEGEATVKLLLKSSSGDDSLGKVSISEDKAGADHAAKFQEMLAEYKLAYRVDAVADDEEEGEWWLEEGEDVFDFSEEELGQAEPEAGDAGPTGEGAPGDPVEPCPLGRLTVRAVTSEGALIAGAQVVVSPDGFSTTTNFDGTVGPVQLPDGVYTVEVSKESYLPKPFTQVAVIVPGVDLELTAVIDIPDFGVSIQADDVACPGHKHRVNAVVDQPGGTFDWTVESGSIRLVDAAGNPTTSGDTVFVHGLKPQTVELSVKYSKGLRTATDTKTIKIHGVDFTVSNFSVQRGISYAFEKGAGLHIGNGVSKPTFAMDPKVRISIAEECPRKGDCAQNFEAGWLQTVMSNDAESLYPNTKVTDTIPIPIRDARGGDTQWPFYNGDEMQPFFQDGQENTVHIEDSPDLGPADWADPRPGGGGDLESMTMKSSFTAWLAVRNIEWSNDVSKNDSLTFLKHISWRGGMTVPVDCGEAIGDRAGKRSERVRHWDSGDGQGATSPDLGRAIANKANVHAANAR